MLGAPSLLMPRGRFVGCGQKGSDSPTVVPILPAMRFLSGFASCPMPGLCDQLVTFHGSG